MKEKLAGLLISIIYRTLTATARYELQFDSEEDRKSILEDLAITGPSSKYGYIYSFFHQDELSLLKRFQNKKIAGMCSPSKDGMIMGTVMEELGFIPVRGSSNKRPIAAFIESLKLIKQGYKYGIAVDGPRGPIFEVKPGVIKLSEKANRPIVPHVAIPEKYIQSQKAWNKIKLPLPFTKIVIKFGKVGFYTQESLERTLKELKGIS